MESSRHSRICAVVNDKLHFTQKNKDKSKGKDKSKSKSKGKEKDADIDKSRVSSEDKCIVRPRFSQMGRLTISENAIEQLVRHNLNRQEEVEKGAKRMNLTAALKFMWI